MWSKSIEVLNPYEALKEANKMENKKIYNDDVERIVNDPERQEAITEKHKKEHEERQAKILTDVLAFGVASLFCGLMGCFGWAAPWVAFPAFAVCGLYSAFLFGRWFEGNKFRGYK